MTNDIWDLTPEVWMVLMMAVVGIVALVFALRERRQALRWLAIREEPVAERPWPEGVRVETRDPLAGMSSRRPEREWTIYDARGRELRTFATIQGDTEEDARTWAWERIQKGGNG